MKTRNFLTENFATWFAAGLLGALIASAPLGAADDTNNPNVANDSVDAPAGATNDSPNPQETEPYKPKTKYELRRSLRPMQYKVTQEEGTEPAFRNEYWNNKHEGVYQCVVCGLPLFSSQTKFESGTGWPSFFAPLATESIGTKRDWKMLYPRTEVHCQRCRAHLGHVFNDGPAPTGLRYCMNSAAMNFKPGEDSGAKKSK